MICSGEIIGASLSTVNKILSEPHCYVANRDEAQCIMVRTYTERFYSDYSQTGCSFPRNIATLPSILQCSCANCSEQVPPELASCNYISFNKLVDFNTILADFR